jgi:4'-phosphopantetheinyl transferase
MAFVPNLPRGRSAQHAHEICALTIISIGRTLRTFPVLETYYMPPTSRNVGLARPRPFRWSSTGTEIQIAPLSILDGHPFKIIDKFADMGMDMQKRGPSSGKRAMVGPLTKGEVRVWWMEVGVPEDTLIAQWRVCLAAAEQAQADRFHFLADQHTYIAAHWLIRQALASVDGLPPADWRFVVEKHGKPVIDSALNRPHLGFNLSHTRGFVACAVSLGITVGIDVEALTRATIESDIAERFFSPSERSIFRGMSPDQQPYTFLRFWTLKEAFIKATGDGLNRALESFSFSLDPVSISFDSEDADDPSIWKFFELRPTPRHLLALALRHPEPWPLKISTCPQ